MGKQDSMASARPVQPVRNHELGIVNIAGYGAGDAANNLAFMTTTMFLLVYYTDVAGISAAAAGTLLLIARFFDAFADIFAGRIVDQSHSKKLGKFRPFILYGAIPLLLLNFAIFNVPDIGHNGKLIYAYITYIVFGLAYSLVNIPYGSLAGAMTRDATERSKLASARMIGSTLVIAFLGVFVAPMLKQESDLQGLFTELTTGFVVIGIALYMFTVFATRETVTREVKNVSFKQSLDTLKTNKPLLLLCLSSFAFLTGMLSLVTIQIYYLRDVLDSLYLYTAASISQLVITLIVAGIVPPLVKLWGKKLNYILGSAIMVVGGLIMLLTPASMVALAFSGLLIAMFGIALNNTIVWALEADTVEYGEWKTGVRTEGSIYALFSFTRKAGQAVGGGLAAFALSWGGYAAHATHQPESAELGIRIGMGLIPIICAFFAILLIMKYPLTDQYYRQITEKIAKSRKQNKNSEYQG